ncbi:hypothetical protein FRC12_011221 [Ceratobasidium sp. 428]|nr:hypothetical protein FRC12_011221 [Ceratobasidium sp. 428]
MKPQAEIRATTEVLHALVHEVVGEQWLNAPSDESRDDDGKSYKEVNASGVTLCADSVSSKDVRSGVGDDEMR